MPWEINGFRKSELSLLLQDRLYYMTLGKFLPAICVPLTVQPQCFACPPAYVVWCLGGTSISLLPLEMYDLDLLYQVLGNTLKVGNILAVLQYFRSLGTAVPMMLSRGQCEGISICRRQKIIYLLTSRRLPEPIRRSVVSNGQWEK